MGKNQSSRPLLISWPYWRWIITVLNVIALILSAIMSWHYLAGGSMAGCGGGSPCEQVLNSRWSSIAGIIPVSGLALGAYLALLVAGLFIGPSSDVSIRRLAWRVMVVLAGSIAGSAIWFTILQKWVIGSFCPWCMTTHTTGLVLSVFIIRMAFKESGNNGQRVNPFHTIGLVLSGIVLAAFMAAAQFWLNPSEVHQSENAQQNMPAIDYHSVPLAGSPDASYIVTLLFDYQCPHCQKIHFMLDEAVRRYNGKLAFAICPAPLNSQCNPYIPQDNDAFKNSCELAKISLAVWIANRSLFADFENWMFTFDSGDRWQPRSLEATKAKAAEMVGKEKFEAALADPWIGQYIQTCTQIYGQTLSSGKGGIPKLIFESRWVYPEPYNADDLISILQNSLAVPAP